MMKQPSVATSSIVSRPTDGRSVIQNSLPIGYMDDEDDVAEAFEQI